MSEVKSTKSKDNSLQANKLLLDSFQLFGLFIDSIDTTGKNITKRRLRNEFQVLRDGLDISESAEENLKRIKALIG